MLLPPTVQDFIALDAAVRVIDVFVTSLDLHSLGFERARPATLTGRPGYEPGALLRLYLYGYVNQLRSSRRLEKACRICSADGRHTGRHRCWNDHTRSDNVCGNHPAVRLRG